MPDYIANMSQEPLPADLSDANMVDKLIDAAYEHLLVPAMHELSISAADASDAQLWKEVAEVTKKREDLNRRMTEIEDAIRELGSLMDSMSLG